MSLDVVIDFQNAKIGFPEKTILENVNLQINKGEFVYLIGKTASGKSSLIRSLYADLPLLDGKINIAGFDLSTIKRSKIPFLRRKVSTIFQDFQLLIDRSVKDNLLFVLNATGWRKKDEIEARIIEVLQRVGMESKLMSMPHQLSGGEQQRIVIARALLNDPDVILADEPTGNLDPETSEEILKLLTEISQNGRVVLMATHNYSLINKYRFRTLKCQDGMICEQKFDDDLLEFIPDNENL